MRDCGTDGASVPLEGLCFVLSGFSDFSCDVCIIKRICDLHPFSVVSSRDSFNKVTTDLL